MPFMTTLCSTSRRWLEVRYDGLSAEGQVAPTIVLNLYMSTPSPSIDVEIHRLDARLALNNEWLAFGQVAPQKVSDSGHSTTLRLEISPAGLDFIGANLSGDDLTLKLELMGLLRAREAADGQRQLVQSDFPYGEWGYVFAVPADFTFTVARSDWFTKVLSVVGGSRYIAAEIQLPKAAEKSDVVAALARLKDEERAYALGDDPKVFLSCRAMIEALPGYPSDLFHDVDSPSKRKSLDDMFKEAGDFFHVGRHVRQDGPQAGEFPVDHRDAAFALNLARLLLSYLSAL